MGDEAVGVGGETLIITSWDDLEKLDRMTKDVDLENVKVGEIIGEYAMFSKEKRPCGIKQCHSPHFTGRIIELADGRRCYIGIDCGAHYFPNWDNVRSLYSAKQKTRREGIQIAQAVQAACDADRFLQAVSEDLQWFDNASRSFDQAVHPRLRDEVVKKAERNQPTISRESRLSDEERELARTTGQSLRVRTEIVGTLKGLRVQAPGNNPRQLANRLVTIIRALRSMPSERKGALRVAKMAEEIPKLQARIEGALESARLFFEESNLALLRYLDWAKPTGFRSLSVDSAGNVRPQAA